jgi:hypothetical protein
VITQNTLTSVTLHWQPLLGINFLRIFVISSMYFPKLGTSVLPVVIMSQRHRCIYVLATIYKNFCFDLVSWWPMTFHYPNFHKLMYTYVFVFLRLFLMYVLNINRSDIWIYFSCMHENPDVQKVKLLDTRHSVNSKVRALNDFSISHISLKQMHTIIWV